jgi:hypothetical protein
MRYQIPTTDREAIELCALRPDEDLIATAIAGVIQLSRKDGKTLDDLTAELLMEDTLLEPAQRNLLTQIVEQAWQRM